MDTITSEYGEPPRINVVWLREYIKNHSELSQETSETIASAINMGLKQQDTSGFATKSDIKDLKHDIENLRQSTKSDIKDLKHDIENLRQSTKSDLNESTQGLKSDIKIFKRDIIIWILTGTFVINQLPGLISKLINIIGK